MIREKILQAIREYRESEQWHEPLRFPFDIHASETGEKCLRKLYFKRTVELAFQEQEKTLLLFETGNVFHRYIQSLFPDNQIEKEVKIRFKDFRIIGRADIVLNGTIYELKAVSRMPTSPYEPHKCQVEVYMRGLHKERAIICYIQKSTFETLEFEVERDDIRWQEIVLRVRKLVQALKEKRVPEGTYSPSCRWCPYYNICRKMRYF